MQKASLILFTAAFSIGCVGLWMLLALSEGAYVYHFHGRQTLPFLTRLLLEGRLAFLVIPIPFILRCFLTLRSPVNTDAVMRFVGVMSCVFMVLFFGVAVFSLIPWLPIGELIR
jgi:hypothetical protein